MTSSQTETTCTTFLVDDSGSMSGTNISLAKQICTKLHASMSSWSKIRFIKFDTSIHKIGDGQFAVRDVTWLHSTCYSEWTGKGGGTALWASTYQTCVSLKELNMLEPNQTFPLVVITDGDDNSSGTVTNADGSQIVVGGDSAGSKAVIDYITQNQLPVEIHFLGIGPSVSASTTANFKAVADATGGSWNHVIDPSIVAQVNNIVDTFVHNVLSKRPPYDLMATSGDSCARLQWRVEDPSLFSDYHIYMKDCKTDDGIVRQRSFEDGVNQVWKRIKSISGGNDPGSVYWPGATSTVPVMSMDIQGVSSFCVDIAGLSEGKFRFRVIGVLKQGAQSTLPSASSNPIQVSSISAMMSLLQQIGLALGSNLGLPPPPP